MVNIEDCLYNIPQDKPIISIHCSAMAVNIDIEVKQTYTDASRENRRRWICEHSGRAVHLQEASFSLLYSNGLKVNTAAFKIPCLVESDHCLVDDTCIDLYKDGSTCYQK